VRQGHLMTVRTKHVADLSLRLPPSAAQGSHQSGPLVSPKRGRRCSTGSALLGSKAATACVRRATSRERYESRILAVERARPNDQRPCIAMATGTDRTLIARRARRWGRVGLRLTADDQAPTEGSR
jgi:hypothetical protein